MELRRAVLCSVPPSSQAVEAERECPATQRRDTWLCACHPLSPDPALLKAQGPSHSQNCGPVPRMVRYLPTPTCLKTDYSPASFCMDPFPLEGALGHGLCRKAQRGSKRRQIPQPILNTFKAKGLSPGDRSVMFVRHRSQSHVVRGKHATWSTAP